MLDFVATYQIPHLNYDLQILVLTYSGHLRIGPNAVSWVVFWRNS